MNYPKGYLVCIGGAEEKGATEEDQERNDIRSFKYGILDHVVNLMRGNSPTVEVITTASSIPEEYYQQYKIAFEKAGCGSVGHIDIRDAEMAKDESFINRIEKADGVMITGGDQLKLFNRIGSSKIVQLLKKRYHEEHFVIAGTSAGAAAMSNTMICGGNPVRAFFKGEIRLNPGFALFNDVIIDTHFDKRGRFGRLAQAVASHDAKIGLGLSEDTGVIVERGSQLRAIGSGSVVVIEGDDITYNNTKEIENGKAISVANLTVHLMSIGDEYDMTNQTFKPSVQAKTATVNSLADGFVA